MARPPQAAVAAVAATAFWLLCLPPAATQMVSPLQGQGQPRNETVDVFFSMYLDRLIEVDDRNYRHKGIYMTYITWNDSSAYETVRRNTELARNGSRPCSYQCTDWGRDVACCDEIFIPSIVFRNAYGFPQDRPTGYKIYVPPPPSTSVMWHSLILGEFYQQMSLKHYPFDSFDLGIATEVLDTAEPPHPGLRWHLSGGGMQKYGVGDDVSDWRVTQVQLSAKLASNESFIFQLASPDPSHPLEPLPLSGPTASRALTPLLPGGALRAAENGYVSMIFLKIRITRNWRFHFLNTILPVAMLAWLAFVIFVLPRKELATRLGVAVTLFLALAAVQFVVTADQPSSSYILPTQQQILCTYGLLVILALESIVVCLVETYKERRTARARQRAARKRYLARVKALQSLEREEAAREAREVSEVQGDGIAPPPAPPELAATNSGNGSMRVSFLVTKGPEAGGTTNGHGAGKEPRPQRHSSLWKPARAPTLATMREVLADDESYCQWLAGQIDLWSAICLFFAYNVAIILIFTLQSGYTDLLIWEGPPPPWGT